VARNGSWAENWGAKFTPGGQDLEIEVPADHTVVHFLVDFNSKTILNSVSEPTLKVDLPTPQKLAPEDQRFSSFSVQVEETLGLDRGILALDGTEGWELTQRGVLEDVEFQPIDASSFGASLNASGQSDRLPGTGFCTWSPLADEADVVVERDGESERSHGKKNRRECGSRLCRQWPGARYATDLNGEGGFARRRISGASRPLPTERGQLCPT